MKNRNCLNCAAPIEINTDRCPYCGTLYLDLSMINFDEQEPFFLTIKKDGTLITQKVMPQTASFEHTYENVDIYDGRNNKIQSFITSNRLETNIQFIAIPFDEKGRTMCEVRYDAPVA